MSQAELLEVYHAGELTVVGFGGRDALDDLGMIECRSAIEQLVSKHQTKVLVFDLTKVLFVPSGMLGLFASLNRTLNIDVHVFNPNEDIREVLELTKLNRLIGVHSVELA